MMCMDARVRPHGSCHRCIAYAMKVEALLRQLNNAQAPIKLSQIDDILPDETSLMSMLTTLDANDSLASSLATLMGQILSFSEQDVASEPD